MSLFSTIGSDGDGGGLDYQYPSAIARPQPSAREIAIAVIAILFVASIVLVVLRRQAEQARGANCENNMRQIGEATLLYAQDDDDSLPNRLTGWPSAAVDWRAQEAYTWRAALLPYLHPGGPLRCLSNPMNEHPTGCTVSLCGPIRSTDGFTVSYACNDVPPLPGSDLARGFCADKGATPVTLRSIESPSTTVAVVEDLSNWSEFNVLEGSFADKLFTGHNGASNYLFADDHVARMTPAQTLSPTNIWDNSNAPFAGQELFTARDVLELK